MMLRMNQLVRTQTRVNLSQEHPLSLIRKILRTLGLRREILKSSNRKSSISVITVAQLDILDLITISDQPLNKAIARLRRETRISFHPLLLLLEIYSKPLCSFELERFQFFLPPPTPPPNQRCGRKKNYTKQNKLYKTHTDFALLVCFTFLF